MQYFYLLQHCYEKNYGEQVVEETKILGIYSSKALAEKAIERLKDLPGFNNYSLDCFYIDKYEIDKDYWSEGFGFNI
ncbi:DUF7336 domain-containing protein [Neobacillus sp. K501]